MRYEINSHDDNDLTSWDKNYWYISKDPLPEAVSNLPQIPDDKKYCAYITALW